MEHEHVRRIDGVGPIDPAGGDDANGRFGLFHHANLDRGGLASQQGVVVDVEIVERVAGGMLGGDIEGDEVVPFVLDLGAVGDGKAHSGEYLQQLVYGLGDDVALADSRRQAGQGDVYELAMFLARSAWVIFSLACSKAAATSFFILFANWPAAGRWSAGTFPIWVSILSDEAFSAQILYAELFEGGGIPDGL